MKVPVTWLRELVELPDDVTTEQLAARLTQFDLKLEEIISSGISGPLVVGRVLSIVKEPQKNGKTINWCRVDVGPEHNTPTDEDGAVARHRLRRAQLRRGRPRRGLPARHGAPGAGL